MNSLSRRRFLKLTGFSIGAAAAATSLSGVVKGANKIQDKTGQLPKGIQKIPTTCDICFWKCGAIAYLRDGKLWKIEGNPDDPLSQGRLCPRGTAGIGTVPDPDRLRSPLIRKGERGSEKWVEVTWGEALDYIAAKMKKIKVEHGPESMALFSHGIGGNFLKHMLKAYGSKNIAAPSFAQCRGPRDVGFELTFGDIVGSPERIDILNSKCLVLIGSHLGENMHNTQVQEFGHAIDKGLTTIVVDPRFSVAAGKAKHYLPIKPGTDTALLLAWMHVIVKEGLYDKEYVQKHGFGFEQFKAHVSQYSPEWAFPITGLEPEQIRESAREMAKNAPATIIHPGRHTTWYGNDTQRLRAVALLNGLLGSWGRKGGYYYQTKFDVPAYPYPEYPKPKRGTADNPNGKYPFASSSLSTGIRDATLTGNPYPIKGWMVYATNLMQSLPNRDETIKAIQNLDLLVVVDVVGSEIAGYADVVLPESVYLERFDDLNTPMYKEPFVALRQKVVDSPSDQKPNYWIAKKLGEKLGLKKYFPWNDIEDYLRTRVESAGLNYDELKKNGIAKGIKEPINEEEGAEQVFYTPSEKIEFYSTQLAEAGFDPIPTFEAPDEAPAGYFRLLYGRAPVHTFSKTQSNRLLSEQMSENEIWVNANVAKKLGLNSGEYIKLKNQDGKISNKIKVKATERIRPEVVYMVHGFGQRSKMIKSTYMKGASDSFLLTKYNTDPLMGGTGLGNNFVTFEWEV